MLKLGQIIDKEAEAEALVSGWREELAAIQASIGDGLAPRVCL
ncbi:MAG: hypothetical protein AAF577_16985 [Pseudomonadota bacterium]